MQRKSDQVSFNQQKSFPIIDKDKLYLKFRSLGANVDRLKQLGLSMQELEELFEHLEAMHDKKLIQFLTTLGGVHPSRSRSQSHGDRSYSSMLAKICPRCSRELSDANIIKENSHLADDLVAFVLVCECGYVREIKELAVGPVSARQSTLQEYARA
jgi:hypothetical protein